MARPKRLRGRSVQVIQLALSLLLAGTLWSSSAVVQAAPVTFNFDATVTGVFPGQPFNLPLIFNEGDIIHGAFTFEPGSGTPTGDNGLLAIQPFELRFDINGKSLATSTYSIQVIDNSPIADFPFSGPVDEITLGCSPTSAQTCMPTLLNLPGGDPFRITIGMDLMGIASILNGPSISENSAVWNSFSLEHSLRLTFDNLSTGSVLILADVGNFAVVPETSTAKYAAILTVVLMGFIVFERTSWRVRDEGIRRYR